MTDPAHVAQLLTAANAARTAEPPELDTARQFTAANPERQAAALAVGVNLAGIHAYAEAMTDPADLRGFIGTLADYLARKITDAATVSVAMADTPVYDFHAIGTTPQSAVDALLAAWRVHAEQTGADPAYLTAEGVNVITGGPGATFRDREAFPRGAVATTEGGPVDLRTYLPLDETARGEARGTLSAYADQVRGDAATRHLAEAAILTRNEFPDAARIAYYTGPSSYHNGFFATVTGVYDDADQPLCPADGFDIRDWADESGVADRIASAADLDNTYDSGEGEITITSILAGLELAGQA